MKNTDRNYPIPSPGVYTSFWIPYGYRYDSLSPSMLVIDEEVADAIRYCFREYISGTSLHGIMHALQSKGYPSPGKRKIQLGLSPQSNRISDIESWKRSTLNQTIINPIYAGDLILSGRLCDAPYYYSDHPVPEDVIVPDIQENHHIALISREEMKKVCNRYLKERSNRKHKPYSERKRARTALLTTPPKSLQSVVYCGECGRLMNEIQILTDGQPTTAYLCSSFALAQPSKCTNRFYLQSEVLAALRHTIGNERRQALRTLQQISGEVKSQQYIRMENRLLRQIDKAVNAVRKTMTETSRVEAQHNSGSLSDAEYFTAAKRLQEEDSTLCHQVIEALIQVREFRETCTPAQPWLDLYTSLPDNTNDSTGSERWLAAVEQIKLYPDRAPEITLAKRKEKEKIFALLGKLPKNQNQNTEINE